MKSSDFGHILTIYSDLPALYGALDSAEAWRALGAFFQSSGSTTVAAICKRFASLKPEPHDGSRVLDVAIQISAIKSFVSPIAKKALVDDLELLSSALAPYQHQSLDAVLAAAMIKGQAQKKEPKSALTKINEDELVEMHLNRLES